MSKLQLAMILTKGPVDLSPESWRVALERYRLPLAAPPEASTSPELAQDPTSAAMTVKLVDGSVLGIMVIPKALPGDDLAAHMAPSMLWPDAPEGLDDYDGHAIMVLHGDDDLVQGRIHLSLAAVATAQHLDAPGIFWSDVPLVSRTHIAARILTSTLDEGELPLFLWIGLAFGRDEAGHTNVITRGLTNFGHAEMWMSSATMETDALGSYALEIVHYVVGNNVTLTPGETLGDSDDQRIEIRGVDSPTGSDEPVLRIAFP